jgi:23S rRNA (guanosine2251-2'-O)-methyltransferase
MRDKEMIFGIRAVIEAIEAGKDIDRVLIKRELSGELIGELQRLIREYDIPMQRVPVERIDRITRKNHQGVIAFTSAVTYQKLENIIPLLYEEGKNPFIIVLDGLTDVRNFGAIARTCEVAGVDAIVIPSRGSVSVNADAIKTSAGALHTIPVCRENSLKEAILFLKNSGVKVVLFPLIRRFCIYTDISGTFGRPSEFLSAAISKAVIRFSFASERSLPIGSCEPVRITGFVRFSHIKLNAEAVNAIVSVPCRITNPSYK